MGTMLFTNIFICVTIANGIAQYEMVVQIWRYMCSFVMVTFSVSVKSMVMTFASLD